MVVPDETVDLKHYTGGLLGDLELVSDRVIFPVQLMQCDRYYLLLI